MNLKFIRFIQIINDVLWSSIIILCLAQGSVPFAGIAIATGMGIFIHVGLSSALKKSNNSKTPSAPDHAAKPSEQHPAPKPTEQQIIEKSAASSTGENEDFFVCPKCGMIAMPGDTHCSYCKIKLIQGKRNL